MPTKKRIVQKINVKVESSALSGASLVVGVGEVELNRRVVATEDAATRVALAANGVAALVVAIDAVEPLDCVVAALDSVLPSCATFSVLISLKFNSVR